MQCKVVVVNHYNVLWICNLLHKYNPILFCSNLELVLEILFFNLSFYLFVFRYILAIDCYENDTSSIFWCLLIKERISYVYKAFLFVFPIMSMVSFH